MSIDYKLEFSETLASSLGTTVGSIMTDCERFGMAYGCQTDCPQLLRGECEIYSCVQELKEELESEEN